MISGTATFVFSSYRDNFMLEEIEWNKENHHNYLFAAFQQTPNSVFEVIRNQDFWPKTQEC